MASRVTVIAALLLGLSGTAASAQTQPSPNSSPEAQTPQNQTPPVPAAPANPDFGQEVFLTEKPIIFLSGNGNWDTAYDTLVDSFKTVYGVIEKEGLKPAGKPMMIYTAADDSGFSFQAAVPIEALPENAPKGDIASGQSPAGRAYKFVHRGSYDSMENTYEAITNFFDEKNLESKDMFIEEYQTDPRSTPEGELVINVLVPVK